MTHDAKYQQRMTDALMEAMFTTSIDRASNTAIMRTEEIVESLTNLAAMVIATSDAVGTPTKKREFCADHAKRLQRRISDFQAEYAAGRTPFDAVITPEGLH